MATIDRWNQQVATKAATGEGNNNSNQQWQKQHSTVTMTACCVPDTARWNWKVQVKEAINTTLNCLSSGSVSGALCFTSSINQVCNDGGAYVAVSSCGNFFLMWEPGDDFWILHNRGTPHHIQNMGFIQVDIIKGIWMMLNGGKLLLSLGTPDLPVMGLTLWKPISRQVAMVLLIWPGYTQWSMGGGWLGYHVCEFRWG